MIYIAAVDQHHPFESVQCLDSKDLFDVISVFFPGAVKGVCLACFASTFLDVTKVPAVNHGFVSHERICSLKIRMVFTGTFCRGYDLVVHVAVDCESHVSALDDRVATSACKQACSNDDN